MVGINVGNYRISALIATGGMGTVYAAEHPGIGRRAAVKVLQRGLARDPQMVTRFLNEARAANAIHHPGIVEIFDSGTLPDGAAYIVMELLRGESLGARLVRRRRLPLQEAVGIIEQAAEALGAAHAVGIIHRDLKPDNLFLVPDPRAPGGELVKLLDFGIAKLGSGLAALGQSTQAGAVMGTPAYMSPEQCVGHKNIDQRSDVYALGVILYEILCGQPPFWSEAFGELAHLHIAVPPPPPRSFDPGIPERVEAVLLRALAKDPAARFVSTRELKAALRAAVPSEAPPGEMPLGVSVTVGPATTGSGGEPPVRRSHRRWAMFAVVFAAAGGTLPIFWRHRLFAARPGRPEKRPAVAATAQAPIQVTPIPPRPAAVSLPPMTERPRLDPIRRKVRPRRRAPVFREPRPI